MNDIPTNVTGGDLNSLWRVANVALPQVENVYIDQMQEVHKVNDPADDQKYGKCHPWWAAVACQLEQALFQTAASLGTTTIILNAAIDGYTQVDDSSGKELNEIGEDLEDILKSEGAKKIEADIPGDYEGPNHNLPDSWSDVHDD